MKYRPSGSDETLLRCVLEAYTYYKLLDLDQIVSTDSHEGISVLRNLKGYKHTKNAELVVLFDEKACTKNDGGYKTNLMLRLNQRILLTRFIHPKQLKANNIKSAKSYLQLINVILCESCVKQS